MDYYENNNVLSLLLHADLIEKAANSKNPLFNLSVHLDNITKGDLQIKYEEEFDYFIENNKRVKWQPNEFYPSKNNCEIRSNLLYFDSNNKYFDIDGTIYS